MFRRGLSLFLGLTVIVLFLAACRGRGEDVGLPTPVETDAGVTFVPPDDATAIATTATLVTTSTAATAVPLPTSSATPLSITAVPSATPAVPPTTAPATPIPPTVNPGPPPGGSARITFAPGATSAVVSSALAAGGDGDTWLLRVNAGQTIIVQTIANPAGQMNVQLLDANGGFLAGNPDTAGISAGAPTTGDYQINLATASGAPAVAYTLQVIVPPGGGPVTPQRIQFAPGQSTAQLQDSLAAGGDLNTYVLTVAAGQTIQVGVFASPPAATTIAIRDAAGQFITSGTDMSGVAATVATAGDYLIEVGNVFAAPAVSYTLTVTVPPLTSPPPVNPTRISFGPGQISARLDGGVSAGAPVHYVIAIGAGQTLITDLNDNPAASVDITISDPAGNMVNFGRGPTSLGTVAVTGGDYHILLSTTSAAAISYGLVVTVPPLPAGNATRIEFAPGATSATVGGDLPFGGDTDTWVIRGLAGQGMNVTLSVAEATGWVRVFVYDAAGQIVALGTDITGAQALLANTGDYRLVVISDQGAGPLSYSLTTEIP